MKRIAFISNSGNMGGAEVCLLDQIEAISEDYEQLVFLPFYGELADRLKEKKIPFVVSYHTPWTYHRSIWWPPLWVVSQLWYPLKMAFIMWRNNVDIVYSNTIMVGSGLFAAFILRKPHICHIHESGLDFLPYNYLFGERLTLYFINQFSQKIILVSHFLNSRFQNYFDQKKVDVIYNCVLVPSINLSVLNGISVLDARPLVIGMVGFMFELKRQEHAILAVAQLKKSGHSVVLNLIGSGLSEYIDYLKQLCVAHDVEDIVMFCGYFKNAIPVMDQCDVIIVCSEIESFSRVAIEGMRLGKLVIVSDRGAMPELVSHKVTGLVFRYGDIDELADLLSWVISNPKETQIIRESGYRWVTKSLTFSNYKTRLLDVIDAAV